MPMTHYHSETILWPYRMVTQMAPSPSFSLIISHTRAWPRKVVMFRAEAAYRYDNGLSPDPTPVTSLRSSDKSRVMILGGIFGTIGVLLLTALVFLVYRRLKDKYPGLPFTNVTLSGSPSGQIRSRWFQGRSGASRHGHSFNPSLFVQIQRPIPNPNPSAMSHYPADHPPPINPTAPPGTGLTTTIVPPTAGGQFERNYFHVIQEWRSRIHIETVMSQVDLSSHYDSTDSHHAPLPPSPPPRPKRRFAVMNN